MSTNVINISQAQRLPMAFSGPRQVSTGAPWLHRGSPIGFFNPVISTLNFVQSRNPEGRYWHPTYRAYFPSRISPWFCFKILNPELQIREVPDPEKIIWNPLLKQKSQTHNVLSQHGQLLTMNCGYKINSYFLLDHIIFSLHWKLLIVYGPSGTPKKTIRFFFVTF